jgi:shikimate dehydrogenase
MYPNANAAPVDCSHFAHLEAVVDLIYNPLHTRLLQQAERLGLKTAGGLSMLTEQGAAAARIWGMEILPEQVRQVICAMRANIQNWVLIGMPGSGKSAIGRFLAQETGRTLVDLDAKIEASQGASCKEIIARAGEEVFRKYESLAASAYGAETGQIISSGGGTILREENVFALRQNGIVLWVQRPLSKLTSKGRPLSSSPEVIRQMERVRLPFYESAADMVLANNTTLREACCAALSAFRFYGG